jgi:hypothetical protein
MFINCECRTQRRQQKDTGYRSSKQNIFAMLLPSAVNENWERSSSINGVVDGSAEADISEMTLIEVGPSNNLSVFSSAAKEGGRRKYNKKQYCPFCQKSVCKLPRHLTDVHAEEPEVAEASRLPLKSAERRSLLDKLLRLANYKHNVRVLAEQSGTIVTARRLLQERSDDEYVPCEYCYAFCYQRDLWKHVQNCKHKPADEDRKRRRRNIGALLLPSAAVASEGLKLNVLSKMNCGRVALEVRNDPVPCDNLVWK